MKVSHIWGGFSEPELLKGRERQSRVEKGSGNIIAIKTKQSASSALTAHGEKFSVLKLMLILSCCVSLAFAAAREQAGHLGKHSSPGRAGTSSADLLMGTSSSVLAFLPLACPFSKLCFPAAQDFVNQAGFHKYSQNHQTSVFKVSNQAMKNLPEECGLCRCSTVFDSALHCWGMLEQVSDPRWELALGCWVLGTGLSFPSFFSRYVSL